ncbi:hypothetical protein SARC_17807, partial [Sphaeroforma arctica JP610]
MDGCTRVMTSVYVFPLAVAQLPVLNPEVNDRPYLPHTAADKWRTVLEGFLAKYSQVIESDGDTQTT